MAIEVTNAATIFTTRPPKRSCILWRGLEWSIVPGSTGRNFTWGTKTTSSGRMPLFPPQPSSLVLLQAFLGTVLAGMIAGQSTGALSRAPSPRLIPFPRSVAVAGNSSKLSYFFFFYETSAYLFYSKH